MKKKFFTVATFLAFKGIANDVYEKMEADKRNELLTELSKNNDEYFAELEASVEGKVSKEDFEALKTANEAIKAESIRLAELIAKNSEKPNNSVEKTELGEFITRKERTTNGWEQTTIKAAALMTTTNVDPNVAGGFNQLFGNAIDSTIYSAPKQDAFIMNLVDTQTVPGTESVWYVERINQEGDASFIAEGALKPLVDAEYKEKKISMKEVALRWKFSNRLINHAPSVVNDFLTHANELMELKADAGVLSGDGTGNNLSGLATLASPFVVPSALANFYPAPTIFDAIMSVATYVRLNNFKGSLRCVLNTVWKAKFFGNKEATTNSYILPSFVAPDGSRVGDIEITFENGMDADKILLGELKRFKVRISEQMVYAEGYENDDFSKNLQSRKIETFMATYLPANHAGAIIYDDIATVLTAIDLAGA